MRERENAATAGGAAQPQSTFVAIVTEGVATVALAFLSIVLYRKATRLWWTYDDAYLLHIATVHPFRDHFLGSSIWRSMPQRLFTPLLTATYALQLRVFGAEAASFYRTQIVLLITSAVAVFWVARLWMGRGSAFTAAALYLLSVPTCGLVSELMLVHYIESIALGSCSVALFAVALRNERSSSSRTVLAVVSAVFYFAAMLAKEIAVPLAPALLLVRERAWKSRVKLLAPHSIALATYALWRREALGEWLGGYGWRLEWRQIPSVVAAFPQSAFARIAGAQPIGAAAIVVVIAIGILLCLRSRSDWTAFIILFVLSVAPIVPVARKLETRFMAVPWLVLVAVACAGFDRVRDRRAQAALLITALAVAVLVNRQTWSHEYRLTSRMSDEARVFVDLGAKDALRAPAIPPAAMMEFKWLKESYLHRVQGTQWFFDDIFLCESPLPMRIFGYVDERRSVVELPAIRELRDRFCRSIRPNAPLRAEFHHEDESLFWAFGPYTTGAYGVVFGNGVQAFELPRTDAFRLSGVKQLTLRVRYRSPSGWVTYSPELLLDFDRPRNYHWARP